MSRTNFYRFQLMFAALLLATSCAARVETESLKHTVDPAAIATALARSDELFRQREDVAKLRESIALLAAVRNPDQRDFEVEWKFAKYNYCLGIQTSDDQESEKAFEAGKIAGRIASRVEPNKPDGHFWYAANLGEQARRSPVTIGIKAIDDIRDSMNRVISIDPGYQAASAYDALAQVELASTGILGGKPEKAVEHLEKALELSSINSNVHLHLAEAYTAVGRKSDARRQLEHLIRMKPDPQWTVEHAKALQKAKKMLESRF